MRQRPVELLKNKVVRVPLGARATYHAFIDLDDWESIQKVGTGNLNYIAVDGGRYAIMKARGNPRQLMVARVILDAGKGERVRFKDGNPFNLRRSNLSVIQTRAGDHE